jgi:hypothetical protein
MSVSWRRLLQLRIWPALASGAAALVLILLPVTSLPALSSLLGGTLVAPPAVLVLFLLALGWLPVYLLRHGTLPREATPWLVYAGAALLSSSLAFFVRLPAYKGHTILGAEMEALLTLGIAAAFYLVFCTWVREPGQLKWAMRWINFGGFLLVVWSLAQLYVILVEKGSYPGFMVRIQGLLSVRSLQDHVYYDRLAGLSYEPSWLAHQLNVLYIPLWLAATITGYSSCRKWLRISLENILLITGSIVLLFSYSRVGLMAFLLVLAYGVYRLNEYGFRRLEQRLQARGRPIPAWVKVLTLPILIGLYALLAVGLLALAGRVNERIAGLLELRITSPDLMELGFRVGLSERLIYWANGWLAFARYPLFGVGLGNAGFFFSEHVHNLGYRSAEIVQVLYEAGYLPNIKSLWVRVLAETGLVGFSCFLAGYHLLWRAGQKLVRDLSPTLRTIGWMGIFSLLAFVIEGFSVDSFALPYLWVATGLLTAASAMARRSGLPPLAADIRSS